MTEASARKPRAERGRFEIYRGADALGYLEGKVQKMHPPSAAALAALAQVESHGDGAGQDVKLVFARPGMSLTYVWFKSGYPLPLHSHSGDCLYYILAGSIRIGQEELGPGDGFFVGNEVPYTYETGPLGVEVLEFRATDELDIRFRAKGRRPWDAMVEKLKGRREQWLDEPPPSRVSTGGPGT